MTSITTPVYKTNSNSFVLEFFKSAEIDSLSLATAKKYFVQLFGINILKGFYYFRNTINCDDQIAGEDLIANDNIVANQLTTNKVVAQTIQAKTITCDEIIMTHPQTIISNNYGFIYIDGMSIPLLGSEANLDLFCVPIKKLVKILLYPQTKILFSSTNSLYTKKLIHNKETRCKLYQIDLSNFNSFALYYNNELKQ